ncbi:cell wall elongation regulator TseB-like domain-containing protein [Neobacillus sp. C211]|uniref:cell wall elongation regulator TseB-like domain-containing protein n=1 Tax=unclassified Neobacillus TaxID=2675272 RepID=UPI0039781B11
MKKWIIFIVIFIVVIFGLLIKVYFTSVDPVKAAEKKAVALANKEISIKEVEDFHIYNGIETVNVIEGKSNNGEKIIVWIPEKSKKVYVKKAKDGLSKEEAIQKLLQEKSPKKVISVRLGMEKNIPLWEIYYRSNNNLINYYYVHFETGEWLKKIENL